MKNYRSLMPIVMIFLVAIGWYSLISGSVKMTLEYQNNLKEAREYAETGVTKYALEHYNAALELKKSPEIWEEVAVYLKKQETPSKYLDWCEQFFEAFPKDSRAYDCLLDAYAENRDYSACFDVLEIADKRNVSSKKITKLRDKIAYEYSLDFSSYEDVRSYSNNYCAVKNDGKWGFVDRFGKQRVSCRYQEVGAYTGIGYAPVIDTDGDAFFIDKTGAKVLATKDKYKQFGMLVDGLVPAEQKDGKYVYLNENLEKEFGDYDYASTMNENTAAVMNGDDWSIINNKGKIVSKETYKDIKLDAKQIACRADRMFVQLKDGKYIMINSAGKQIGSLEFEDAIVFASEAPTAVKIDGKWCFVNKDGKRISDKTYAGARPYSNSLAAVKTKGHWGYVDENEKICIEPEFDGAKDFNEKGSAFVKAGESWQLLKLYRLNREDG